MEAEEEGVAEAEGSLLEAGTLTHATDVAQSDTGRTTAQIISLECQFQTDRGWLTGMGRHQQNDQLKGVTHNTNTHFC